MPNKYETRLNNDSGDVVYFIAGAAVKKKRVDNRHLATPLALLPEIMRQGKMIRPVAFTKNTL